MPSSQAVHNTCIFAEVVDGRNSEFAQSQEVRKSPLDPALSLVFSDRVSGKDDALRTIKEGISSDVLSGPHPRGRGSKLEYEYENIRA
eukprot:8087083-Pyramimonas_sp.AAC.2